MDNTLDNLVSLCKRRGFVIPSSEIYGGLNGIYDFGSYGVELKNNIKKLWWQRFVQEREDIVGMESAILMSRQVWQASGHEKEFIDQLVECKKCHMRFRSDEIANSKVKVQNSKEGCPQGGEHEFTEPKKFNPMFKTYVGPVEDEKNMTYLRPETAQGIFVDFSQILTTSRQKIPFGIAQIGKSFRNEINTKDFLFRIREFEIAEIEYFVPSPEASGQAPSISSEQVEEDEKYFKKWVEEWQKFILDLGIKKENLKLYQHPKETLAHYSKKTIDIMYNFPFGWKELAGIANRADFDLKTHQSKSGKDLSYFDQETGKKFTPYVIVPTIGIERLMLAVLIDAFEESKPRTTTTEVTHEKEIILHLNPAIAPVKIAVFPLIKKDKLPELAKLIYKELQKNWLVEYDETGSIGRRYRRQDEIGTPYCVTVDHDSLKQKDVTVRDRDTMEQERIKIDQLPDYFREKLIR